MEKTDILSLSKEELEEKILAMGEKKFRAGQIYDWLHINKVEEFSKMTNLSAQLREKLDDIFWINSLKIQKRLVSDIDNTVKYLYELPDGNYVETVCMQYHHGTSLCISTQVGCRMGCRFCASAIAGFVRNLTPAEMLLQIYETERAQNCKISSLVLISYIAPSYTCMRSTNSTTCSGVKVPPGRSNALRRACRSEVLSRLCRSSITSTNILGGFQPIWTFAGNLSKNP